MVIDECFTHISVHKLAYISFGYDFLGAEWMVVSWVIISESFYAKRVCLQVDDGL